MNPPSSSPYVPQQPELVYHDLCDVSIPWPAVARSWLHGRMFIGPWDAARIAARMGDDLWLSFYSQSDDAPDAAATPKMRPTCLAGCWPDGGFVELHHCANSELEDHPRFRLRVFAATPDLAARMLDALRKDYLVETKAHAIGPRIGLLNVFGPMKTAFRVCEECSCSRTPKVCSCDARGTTVSGWRRC